MHDSVYPPIQHYNRETTGSRRAGPQRRSSGLSGGDLCGILDANFREATFETV
jgi:hypothetical protein